MTPQVQIALIGLILSVLCATLIPFCVWIVRRDTANQLAIQDIRKEMAEQATKFVTWEFVKEFRTWQSEHDRSQQQRDSALQSEMKKLGESLAYLQGQMQGHSGA